jgi:hypothetical protein
LRAPLVFAVDTTSVPLIAASSDAAAIAPVVGQTLSGKTATVFIGVQAFVAALLLPNAGKESFALDSARP